MVGIVIVSHSATLAGGVVELARQMAGAEVAIEPAGGMDGPDRELGTDATLIMAAIERAEAGDGVLVLMDLGSAILSAEMALELLGDEVAANVRLCPAPLVEGAVAAAVAAGLGASMDEVAAEALGGLDPKRHQLGIEDVGSTAAPAAAEDGGDWRELRLRVPNPLGLHARPAAAFVTTAGRFDAEVVVRNLSTGEGPVSARSLNGVATLGARQGHDLLVRARGEEAEEALAAIARLAAEGFGDRAEGAPADGPPPPVAERTPAPAAPDGTLTGVAASPGVALGAARHLVPLEPEIPDRPAGDPASETAALGAALERVRGELAVLRADLARRAGEHEARILDAHLLMLDDPALVDRARAAIAEGEGAAAAWHAAVEALVGDYQRLEDELMRARAADVREVGRRVLAALAGEPGTAALVEPGILVADDLAPGETAALDPELVRGIATALGGPTSHSAVIARALGVPAVVGLGPALLEVPEGTELALDGRAGTVTVEPAPEVVAAHARAREAWRTRREEAGRRAAEPARTRDGVRIEVAANLARPADLPAALAAGAEGVGLFRTEFLFMSREAPPTEEEQHAVYEEVARGLDGRPLVLRTLDAGADKPVPYLGMAHEDNPFLGVRGVRLTLERPDLMRTQLRAALRVAAEHPLRLMFPMVATLDEWRRARALVDAAGDELRAEGIEAPERPQVGVMIEVPAAALTAEALAREADFFSVGTNDLTQYALAAERGNPRVAGLADPLHPAVLRLIAMVVRAAAEAPRPVWVGVCGEAAGDPEAVPVLVGLGVRELSAGASAIPVVKEVVRGLDLPAAERLAEEALAAEDAAAVRALVSAAT